MGFNFNCPLCGKALAAEEEWVGRQTVCPSCGENITIRLQADLSPCPECGNPLRPDAAICTGCGFNIRTGRKTKSRISHSKPEKPFKFHRTSRFFYMLEGGMYLWFAGIIILLFFAAFIVFFLMKNFPMAAAFGTVFISAGSVLFFIACVVLIVSAFLTGIFWGIGVLLIPPVSLLFILCHWSKSKKAVIMAITALLIAGSGLLMKSFAEYAGKKQDIPAAEAAVEIRQ